MSRWTDQARHVADRLRAVGLGRVAGRVDALIVAVGEQRWQPDPLELADAWADAAIAIALGRKR